MSGMAATRAVHKVPADTRRIENLLDGWQTDFASGNRREFLPIKQRAENPQKMPPTHAG
jgi:hypothetical protein